MNEMELKERLEKFDLNEFRPQDESELLSIIPEMLLHIGVTDSYLRDDLIHTAFGTWILGYDIISQKQLHELLFTVMSEQYMFYKIGEQGTDTVFQRSFSILLLPILLIAHRTKPFLTSDEVRQIKRNLISYLKSEKDRRGFVKEKGWAHAIAHAADAIDDLVQCPEMVEIDLKEILETLHIVISVQDTAYVYGEDERLVTVVIAIIRRGLLSDSELDRWIRDFSEAVFAIHSVPQNFIIRTNVKNFLQALYFRLQWEQMADRFDIAIAETLHAINLFVNDNGN